MKLFREGLPFYKGNLHLHTTNSDGRISPEEAMQMYKAAGYDFLAITDHWKYSYDGYHDGMLLLPGTELDFYLETQVVHIVCLGISEEFLNTVSRENTVYEAIEAARADGATVVLAHPAWSLNTHDFIKSLEGVGHAEIYNTVSGRPWNADRADSSAILDIAAANGKLMKFIACDDAHFYDGDNCQSFIRLQADDLSRESVMKSINAGNFYASRGPEFYQVEITNEDLHIDCSPVDEIVFFSNMPFVRDRCRVGSGMTEATYNRASFAKIKEGYIRCRITDAQGRSAWISPMAYEG